MVRACVPARATKSGSSIIVNWRSSITTRPSMMTVHTYSHCRNRPDWRLVDRWDLVATRSRLHPQSRYPPVFPPPVNRSRLPTQGFGGVDCCHLHGLVGADDGRIGLNVFMSAGDEIHDADHIEEAADGAGVSAQHDPHAVLDEFRKLAVRDAAKTAEHTARGSDIRSGRTFRIVTSSSVIAPMCTRCALGPSAPRSRSVPPEFCPIHAAPPQPARGWLIDAHGCRPSVHRRGA